MLRASTRSAFLARTRAASAARDGATSDLCRDGHFLLGARDQATADDCGFPLQRMEAAGCLPSIGTWNTLLGLLVNPGEGGLDVGVEILAIMRRADVPINQGTFAALANVRKAIDKAVRVAHFWHARAPLCPNVVHEHRARAPPPEGREPRETQEMR